MSTQQTDGHTHADTAGHASTTVGNKQTQVFVVGKKRAEVLVVVRDADDKQQI